MDKFVIFAVAGSGKTTSIINSIQDNKRTAIITYTNANIANIRAKLIDHHGHFPSNVTLFPFFTFLYNFCLKPYLYDRLGVVGINFKQPTNYYIPASSDSHYIDPYKMVYSSRITKLIGRYNLGDLVVKRVEKYFDSICIDEIQDISGRDFDLLGYFGRCNRDLLLVGDFYQHTFDTSRDGNYNVSLFDNFDKYRKRIFQYGFQEHPLRLIKSHRCSHNVCELISKRLGISIDSGRHDNTAIEYVESQEFADRIFNNDSIIKLFYSQHSQYSCHSNNWGACKGEDLHHDICVVLNKTCGKKWIENTLHEIAPSTRNKLYVALTRARGNVYVLSEHLFYKFKTRKSRNPSEGLPGR